jgi:hypothetical protein
MMIFRSVVGTMLLVPLLVVVHEHFAVAAQCTVRGDEADRLDVTVHPADAEPFTLCICGAPVKARIPNQSGAETTIEVGGPLQFSGTLNEPRFTLTRVFSSPDGMVVLRPGAILANAFGTNSAVVGSVLTSVNSDDVFEKVSPVRVPCAFLSLDPLPLTDDDYSYVDYEDLMSVTREWWYPKFAGSEPRPIFLYPRPSAKAVPIRYDVMAQSPDCLPLAQVDTRGSWLLVRTAGRSSRITGWIQRSLVEKSTNTILNRCTDWADNKGKFLWRGCPEKPLFRGRAKVFAGATVFSRPPRGQWGLITSDIVVDAQYSFGSEWVQLRGLPRVCFNGSPSEFSCIAYVEKRYVSWRPGISWLPGILSH